MYNSLLSLKIFLQFVLFPQALKPSTNFNLSKLKYFLRLLLRFLIVSILKLKILSDRTSPFGFFFWELLARVGRDHSTTVLSSVTQVGFNRWPRDKMAFRHWVLFTKRKFFGHFFFFGLLIPYFNVIWKFMAESGTRQVYLLWWRPQRTDLSHISQGKGFRNLWSLRQFLSF